jgi:hypothetical protein
MCSLLPCIVLPHISTYGSNEGKTLDEEDEEKEGGMDMGCHIDFLKQHTGLSRSEDNGLCLG